jgi:chaperone modulatory protein CbpM
MHNDYVMNLRLVDACHALELASTQVLEIVEHGIIIPVGETPEDWLFDLQMISTARRAMRLQRDLQLEWSAVALVLELIEERDRLRAENAMLQRQLQRFLND